MVNGALVVDTVVDHTSFGKHGSSCVSTVVVRSRADGIITHHGDQGATSSKLWDHEFPWWYSGWTNQT